MPGLHSEGSLSLARQGPNEATRTLHGLAASELHAAWAAAYGACTSGFPVFYRQRGTSAGVLTARRALAARRLAASRSVAARRARRALLLASSVSRARDA